MVYLPSKCEVLGSVPQYGIMAHTCNPGTQSEMAEESEVQGHPHLPMKFKTRLEYTKQAGKQTDKQSPNLSII